MRDLEQEILDRLYIPCKASEVAVDLGDEGARVFRDMILDGRIVITKDWYAVRSGWKGIYPMIKLVPRTNAKPSFGPYLRAARLVYHWSDRHGCFIRILCQSNSYRIDLTPAENVPARFGAPKEEYSIWWEAEDVNDLLDACQALRILKLSGLTVAEPCCIFVDEQGRPMQR